MCNASNELRNYSIDSLMTWRNTASARIDKTDKDLEYLENCMIDIQRRWNKLLRKRRSDVRWVVKLNHALDFKVFTDRSFGIPAIVSETVDEILSCQGCVYLPSQCDSQMSYHCGKDKVLKVIIDEKETI